MPEPATLAATAEALGRFYDFVKDFKLFHGQPDYPSFDELTPEEQMDIMFDTIAQEDADRAASEDSEGIEAGYYDFIEVADELDLLGRYADRIPPDQIDLYKQLNPGSDGFDPFDPLNSGTPYLTEGQVKIYQDVIGELQRKVNAEEITREQGQDAVSQILTDMGVPHDRATLDMVAGGISDEDGLVSRRWEITENPSEALAGGESPTAEQILTAVLGDDAATTPAASDPSAGGAAAGGGGADSPVGTEQNYRYEGDGVFVHLPTNTRVLADGDVGELNEIYTVGGTYSGPESPGDAPGTVVEEEDPFPGLGWPIDISVTPGGTTQTPSVFPGSDTVIADTTSGGSTPSETSSTPTSEGSTTGGSTPSEEPTGGPIGEPTQTPAGTPTGGSIPSESPTGTPTGTPTGSTTGQPTGTPGGASRPGPGTPTGGGTGGSGGGSGGGAGPGDGGGGTSVAIQALTAPSTIAEIFRPELFKTARPDISHLLDLSRRRRMG